MFIVIEGMDGSGKSTIAKALKDKLVEQNKTVKILREPGGNKCSEEIRSLIFQYDNLDPLTETFLFYASRTEFLKNLQEAINKYDYVICDRYYYSTFVYQGIVKGVGVNSIKDINDILFQKYPKLKDPDLVIFLDINPSISKNRRENESFNRFDNESIEFFEKVYKGYIKIFNKQTKCILKIKGNKSLRKIIESISQKINIF